VAVGGIPHRNRASRDWRRAQASVYIVTPLSLLAAASSSPLLIMSCAPALPKSSFALAQINGNVCLAQIPPSKPGSAASALSAVDVIIFAHEFINIFRFSHRAIVHPADIHVIDPIDDDSARYEEENETVFLSKVVMQRFSKLTVRRPVQPIRQSRMRRALRSSRTPPLSAPPILSHFSHPVR